MLDSVENLTLSLGRAFLSSDLGAAEFFVAVLVACGFAMMALASLLPRGKAGTLEWWER